MISKFIRPVMERDKPGNLYKSKTKTLPTAIERNIAVRNKLAPFRPSPTALRRRRG